MRVMKKKAIQRRVWKSVADVSDKEIVTILRYIKGELGIMEFMALTGTSQSGCYSLIARGIRAAYKMGKLKV